MWDDKWSLASINLPLTLFFHRVYIRDILKDMIKMASRSGSSFRCSCRGFVAFCQEPLAGAWREVRRKHKQAPKRGKEKKKGRFRTWTWKKMNRCLYLDTRKWVWTTWLGSFVNLFFSNSVISAFFENTLMSASRVWRPFWAFPYVYYNFIIMWSALKTSICFLHRRRLTVWRRRRKRRRKTITFFCGFVWLCRASVSQLLAQNTPLTEDSCLFISLFLFFTL